jgi:hypothetical protein
MRWVRIAMVAVLAIPAAACGSTGSGSAAGGSTAWSPAARASSTPSDGGSSTAGATSQAPSTTTSSSTVPAVASTNGAIAIWDLCGVAGPTQVVDAGTGTQITTVGLQGVPSWSPDGRRIATMDHLDGMVKIADVMAGTVEVVADPEFGPYRTGDSCGTFAKVGWSVDGTSLLLQYGGTYGDDIVVRVVRVDGSGDRTLLQQPQKPGTFWQLDTRWLADGNVMITYFASDESGDIGLQRGDPWGSWPPPATGVPRPDFPYVYAPSISLPATASPSPSWATSPPMAAPQRLPAPGGS